MRLLVGPGDQLPLQILQHLREGELPHRQFQHRFRAWRAEDPGQIRHTDLLRLAEDPACSIAFSSSRTFPGQP